MWVETQPSAQSSFQKLNVDNSCQKTRKIRYYIFEVLPNFIVSLYFVPYILSRIVDIVMLMYNLLEYNKNYRKKTGSLWNYYRDEPDNPPLNDDDPPTFNYNADPIANSESFKCKSSITGKT